MIFHQLFDPESSTYTYVLGDEARREAVVIDPVLGHERRDLELLARESLGLAWILDTHVHADHVTGANALKAATGARTAVGDACNAPGYDHALSDGERIAFGSESIAVIATPGHTPGSTSFAWRDRVFTGDTLLIGGCGRTDFQGGDAGALYASITRKLFALPDETLVFPGHDYKGRTQSSIGEEKAGNPRFAGRSEAEFVAIMASLGLARPRRIDEAVPLNKVAGPVAAGMVVADLRDPGAAAAAPLPHAVLVPYHDFDRLAELAAGCSSLVLVCGNGQRSLAAARELAAMGVVNVANVVGGIRAMRVEQE
jgi:glyoxylase-like metal-dependent hydrolase (beta-lactamase superfamily II)